MNTDRTPSPKKRTLINQFIPVDIVVSDDKFVVVSKKKPPNDPAEYKIQQLMTAVNESGVEYNARDQIVEYAQVRLKSLAQEALELAALLRAISKDAE